MDDAVRADEQQDHDEGPAVAEHGRRGLDPVDVVDSQRRRDDEGHLAEHQEASDHVLAGVDIVEQGRDEPHPRQRDDAEDGGPGGVDAGLGEKGVVRQADGSNHHKVVEELEPADRRTGATGSLLVRSNGYRHSRSMPRLRR